MRIIDEKVDHDFTGGYGRKGNQKLHVNCSNSNISVMMMVMIAIINVMFRMGLPSMGLSSLHARIHSILTIALEKVIICPIL